MAEVNRPESLSREKLIQLMNKQDFTPAEKNIILFNFDTADVGENGVGTEGAGDKVLKGFELDYFYKLMGWNKDDEGSEQVAEKPLDNKTGSVRAEYNPQDKTTLVYDEEKGTITKYDENNNILGVTDLEGNPINKPDETPTTPKKSNLSKEEINAQVRALKPGESYTYVETSRISWGSGKSATRKTIRWTRNNDGTLSRFEPEYDANSRKSFLLETRYSDDMTTKISEEKLTRAGSPFGVKSKIEYDAQGNPVSETTPLKNIKSPKGYAATKEGFLLNMMRSGRFSSQEIRDNNGNVILTFSNGEYKNEKGKVISADKAYDILERAFENGEVQELVQNH